MIKYTCLQGQLVSNGERWNRRHRYDIYALETPHKHGGAPAIKIGPIYDYNVLNDKGEPLKFWFNTGSWHQLKWSRYFTDPFEEQNQGEHSYDFDLNEAEPMNWMYN